MGQFGHEPEPSQATGTTRVRCILGTFLGVVCHCFPPRLDVSTFTARCLHVRNDARDPSSEKWNYGRKRLPGNFAYMASIHAIRNLRTCRKSVTWVSTLPLDHRSRSYDISELKLSQKNDPEFKTSRHALPCLHLYIGILRGLEL